MSDTTLTNRAIAERLGWTDVREDKARVAFVDSVVLTGIPPQPNGDIQVPDYLHSTDAALTLPLDDEHFWMLWGDQDWWEATVTGPTYSDDRITVKATSAAAAVCAAWWAWMDERED